MMEIESAPWSKEHELQMRLEDGRKVKRCHSCDLRTDREHHLFSAVLPADSKPGARCLSPDCWGKKRDAYLQRMVDLALEQSGNELWPIVGQYFAVDRKGHGRDMEIFGRKPLMQYQYSISEDGSHVVAKKGIFVSGPRLGEVIDIWISFDDFGTDDESPDQPSECEPEPSEKVMSRRESDAKRDEVDALKTRLIELLTSEDFPAGTAFEIDEDEPGDDHCQYMAAIDMALAFGVVGAGAEDAGECVDGVIGYSKYRAAIMNRTRADMYQALIKRLRVTLLEELRYSGGGIDLDTPEDVMLLARDLGYSQTRLMPLSKA
jgi:hypothetical protein